MFLKATGGLDYTVGHHATVEHKVMLICTAHYPKSPKLTLRFLIRLLAYFLQSCFLVFAVQTLTRASYTLLHELNLITRTVSSKASNSCLFIGKTLCLVTANPLNASTLTYKSTIRCFIVAQET